MTIMYNTTEELIELLVYAEEKEDSGVVIKLRAELKEILGYDIEESEVEQRRRNIRRA